MAESKVNVRRGSGSISAGEVLDRRQQLFEKRKEEEKELANREDMTPEEAEAKAKEIAEKEVKIAQILSQGVTSFALRVEDPDEDRRYVWVRDKSDDLARMRAVGYRLEKEKGEGMHGKADGTRKVGDVVLMSISREDYEIIKRVEQRQKERKVQSPIKQYLEDSQAAHERGEAAPPVDLLAQG